MKSPVAVIRVLVILSAVLALPVTGLRAGSGSDRHDHGFDGRGAARCHRAGRSRGFGQQLRSRHRCPRGLSHSRARRLVQDHGGVRRLRQRQPGRVSSCSSGRRITLEPADGAVGAAGDRHGHRRSAADRDAVVGDRRQHRSAAGAGSADGRPQLDVAGAAGAGQPHQRSGRAARAGSRATCGSSSSTSTACRSRRTSAPATSRATATMRSPSSSSSRTGSTRRRAARPACRSTRSPSRAPTS